MKAIQRIGISRRLLVSCGRLNFERPLSSSLISNNVVQSPSLLHPKNSIQLTSSCVGITKRSFHSKGPDEFDMNDIFGGLDPVKYDFPSQHERNDMDIDLKKRDYTDEDLISFQKNFRSECVNQSSISEEEQQKFLAENSITQSGIDVPKPILSFEELVFPENITRALKDFTTPTPIQCAALPVALGGRDLVGVAQTGSGKTLSFLLPAMIHIMDQERSQRGDGPIALVLCPTRELAQQCHQVAKRFAARETNIACVYGGASRHHQANRLHQGCELVIATPGRLMDFIKSGDVDMKRCTFLVLDEADRMLDMGFEPQIRRIVDQIRPDRQVTMWSATWPKSIAKLARDYLTSPEGPVNIKIGSAELIANKGINQKFEITPQRSKQSRFMDVLEETVPASRNRREAQKVLVFVNTKRTGDYLAKAIRRCGYPADSLHGDKNQSQRDRLLADFRNGYCQVMVATNVAARGLDVDNIDFVFNYDFPQDFEDYIHRIGRTARGGKTGTAVSMLTEENGSVVDDLVQSLKDAEHPVDPKLVKLREWFHLNKKNTKNTSRKPRSRGGSYGNSYDRSSRSNYYGRYDDDDGDDYGESRYRSRGRDNYNNSRRNNRYNNYDDDF